MDAFVRAAADGKLRAVPYDGFWAPMDTLKERTALEEQYRTGCSPWAVWRDRPVEPRAPGRPGRGAGTSHVGDRLVSRRVIGLAPRTGRLDVLCLGAHPDDIEIGCGGTLLTLARRPADDGHRSGADRRRARADGGGRRGAAPVLPRCHGRGARAARRAAARALGRRSRRRSRTSPAEPRPTVVLAPAAGRRAPGPPPARHAGQHGLARRADPALRDPQVGRRPRLADHYVAALRGGRAPQGRAAQRCFPSQAATGTGGTTSSSSG